MTLKILIILIIISVIYTQFPYGEDRLRFQKERIKNLDISKLKCDYAVIGAGSAGSVFVKRLAVKYPKRDVCVFEAGVSDNIFEIESPAAFSGLQGTTYDWNYKNNQSNLIRVVDLPRGKVVGGSSSFNTNVYTRGIKSDYDRWVELGADGWSWNEVLPYFKKSERNLVDGLNETFHNSNGEWVVDEHSYRFNVSELFLDSVVNFGIPETYDFNNGDPLGEELGRTGQVGYTHVNILNGKRFSLADAFLTEEILNMTNVYFFSNTHVEKILFKNKKVKSVKAFDFENSRSMELDVQRKVILTAGAYNTPQLLMLSGIGPKEHLLSMGIEVVHNLPGVGRNLSDHGLIGVTVLCDNVTTGETEYIDNFLPNFIQWLETNTGPFASNIGEVYIELEIPTPSGVGLVNINFGPVIFALDGKYVPEPGQYGISAGPDLMKPRSKGYVELKSSNPYDSPNINHNYLSDPFDTEVFVASLNYTRNLFKNAYPVNQYCKNELLPGENVQSFEQWVQYIKEYLMTGYHPCGTARMGKSDDPYAVCDPDGEVYGVKNLIVADASLIPEIPSANINAAVVMIAEKIVDKL